jgi:ferredoxin
LFVSSGSGIMSELVSERVSLDLAGLQVLFDVLRAEGYELIGPRVRDGAIALDRIQRVDDLPRGVGDEQAPGRYRLRERQDGALFGYAASPHSAKRELLVPRAPLLRIRKKDRALEFQQADAPQRKLALIGVRACELAAIEIQDRVLGAGARHDADYAARRAQLFTMAVQCGDPAGTCFCVSMGTGPRAEQGFDLAATELLAPEHVLVFEVGSARGAELLAQVPSRPASAQEIEAGRQISADASRRMGRSLQTEDLPARLMQQLEHPRWDQVADRCLGCANCTMVCPTCFCTTVEDVTDLSGELATRERRWDSCFSADFAYVAGGSARPTLRARYRQWLTHKLATWHEQFGSSGCVGCGRCITWCPVGIDITEEAAAISGSGGGA